MHGFYVIYVGSRGSALDFPGQWSIYGQAPSSSEAVDSYLQLSYTCVSGYIKSTYRYRYLQIGEVVKRSEMTLQLLPVDSWLQEIDNLACYRGDNFDFGCYLWLSHYGIKQEAVSFPWEYTDFSLSQVTKSISYVPTSKPLCSIILLPGI